MKRARRQTERAQGYKDTDALVRLVAGTVDPHRASAELEFLRALNARLPVDAFDELSQLPPERAGDWARRWHIHCPCVLNAARSLASLAQTWRDDAGGEVPKRGTPISDVSQLLGHTNPSTTSRYLRNKRRRMAHLAVDRLDQARADAAEARTLAPELDAVEEPTASQPTPRRSH